VGPRTVRDALFPQYETKFEVVTLEIRTMTAARCGIWNVLMACKCCRVAENERI